MEPNKVVVRYLDGRVLKGHTNDFLPTKDSFHLTRLDEPAAKPVEVHLRELKAIFFVRDFTGNPQHIDRKEFDPSQPLMGRKIQVLFKDGELLVGTTQGYQPGRTGFFVTPADPESNHYRCFVISGATREVSFI